MAVHSGCMHVFVHLLSLSASAGFSAACIRHVALVPSRYRELKVGIDEAKTPAGAVSTEKPSRVTRLLLSNYDLLSHFQTQQLPSSLSST